MSVTKWGKDDGNCGASNNDIRIPPRLASRRQRGLFQLV